MIGSSRVDSSLVTLRCLLSVSIVGEIADSVFRKSS